MELPVIFGLPLERKEGRRKKERGIKERKGRKEEERKERKKERKNKERQKGKKNRRKLKFCSVNRCDFFPCKKRFYEAKLIHLCKVL